MNNILQYIQVHPWLLVLALVAGFVLLVKGADYLVDGASAVAKRFGVSDLVIGLTVVAFGTSMPEFVVNMASVAAGSTDLAITNILGSNIINIWVILGLTAVVYPVVAHKRSRDFDLPLSIIGSILVFVFVSVSSPFGEDCRGITRFGGIILLLLFCYFLYNTFRHAKDHPMEGLEASGNPSKAEQPVPSVSTGTAILFIVGGLIALITGGELIVKSAVQIAMDFGVSEAVIGLTIVALGTSLPELATSVIAATKHNADIALGNVLGSNIFNVFFVLAVSAVIRPLPAYEGIVLDAWMASAGGILVWLFVKMNHEREIKRWGGVALLLIYTGYLIYRLLYL